MKEREMRYLVKFQKTESGCGFFIAPFGYDQFLEIYKDSSAEIHIKEFYGSALNRDYNMEDSRSIKTIQDLIMYVNGPNNQSLVLTNLGIEFAANGNSYFFNDNFECTLTSHNKNQFIRDLNLLFDSLALDSNVLDDVLKEHGNYLILNRNKGIEKKFALFDDYLQSGVTL